MQIDSDTGRARGDNLIKADMKSRILLVDDSYFLLQTLELQMEDLGFKVDMCLNGQDAILQIKTRFYQN